MFMILLGLGGDGSLSIGRKYIDKLEFEVF